MINWGDLEEYKDTIYTNINLISLFLMPHKVPEIYIQSLYVLAYFYPDLFMIGFKDAATELGTFTVDEKGKTWQEWIDEIGLK